MVDEVDFPKVPPSDDRILLAWSKVRSRLHESEHRFNSRYAERYYAGGNADPQEVLDYFVTMYEPAVAMAVKTVTDHESAVACGTELDLLLKRILNICSRLLREVLPKESPEKVKALCSELRRRLLPRSEHWKAEAHKLAQKIPQTGGASLSNQQTARGAALAPAAGEVELRLPPAIGPMEPTESTGAESARAELVQSAGEIATKGWVTGATQRLPVEASKRAVEVGFEKTGPSTGTVPSGDDPTKSAVGPAMNDANSRTDRRKAVDAYIEEVFSRTGKRVTRTEIWKSLRYKSRTEFERWESRRNERAGKKPNASANRRITNFFTQKPHLK